MRTTLRMCIGQTSSNKIRRTSARYFAASRAQNRYRYTFFIKWPNKRMDISVALGGFAKKGGNPTSKLLSLNLLPNLWYSKTTSGVLFRSISNVIEVHMISNYRSGVRKHNVEWDLRRLIRKPNWDFVPCGRENVAGVGPHSREMLPPLSSCPCCGLGIARRMAHSRYWRKHKIGRARPPQTDSYLLWIEITMPREKKTSHAQWTATAGNKLQLRANQAVNRRWYQRVRVTDCRFDGM